MAFFETEFFMFRHEDDARDVYETMCHYKLLNRNTRVISMPMEQQLIETVTAYNRDITGIFGRLQTNIYIRETHDSNAFNFNVYDDICDSNCMLQQLQHVKSEVLHDNFDSDVTVMAAEFDLPLPTNKARAVFTIRRRMQMSTIAQDLLQNCQPMWNWSRVATARQEEHEMRAIQCNNEAVNVIRSSAPQLPPP